MKNIFKDMTPRQKFSDVASDYFVVDLDVAECIVDIINDEFDGIEAKEKEISEEAAEETAEKIASGEIDPGSMSQEEKLEAQELAMREAIEAYLCDYDLEENKGHSGQLYTLTCGRYEFSFIDDLQIEDEKKGACAALLDEMMHEPSFIKSTIVPSWERGETKDEWIEENADMETLCSYNGDYSDFRATCGTGFVWFRVS